MSILTGKKCNCWYQEFISCEWIKVKTACHTLPFQSAMNALIAFVIYCEMAIEHWKSRNNQQFLLLNSRCLCTKNSCRECKWADGNLNVASYETTCGIRKEEYTIQRRFFLEAHNSFLWEWEVGLELRFSLLTVIKESIEAMIGLI